MNYFFLFPCRNYDQSMPWRHHLMMKYGFAFLLPIFLFLSKSTLWAQKEGCGEIRPAYSLKTNSIWALSDSLGLDFNGTNGPQAFNSKLYSGGVSNCATVADSNGQLLFYTNGMTVWTADGSVMPHGLHIAGGVPPVTGGGVGGVPPGQSCQVVQVPFQPEKYYLFTVGTYCNLIDMSLNNGHGDVVDTFALKGVRIQSSGTRMASRIAAVADCSHNVWLLTHDLDVSVFRAYKITAAGMDTVPVISDFSNELPGHNYELDGYIVPSPDGRKIALSQGSSAGDFAYFLTDYSFNPATGQVSDPQILINGQYPSMFGGVAFSPDNSKLYGTYNTGIVNVLLQYDLNSPLADSLVQPTIIDTIYTIQTFTNGIQLGPDGKIYFGNGFQYFPYFQDFGYRRIGRINYPNNVGLACGFEDSVASIDFSSLPVPGIFWGAFPNHVVIPQSSLHISIHFQNDTLFAQPNTFDSYQWYHNGSPVAGGNNPFLSVSDTSGQYAVAVRDTSCGCSDSVLYNITNNLGVGNTLTNNQQIRIYPNPTHDKIFVAAPMSVNLSLYDLTGRLLKQSKGKNEIDIAGFADGVYLLRIEDKQGRFVTMEKVVKRKIK